MIDIATILKDADWNRRAPAQAESIQKLLDHAGKELPEEYLALLRYSDGGDGPLGIQPGWLQLWSSTEVVENNRDYQVEEYIPGFLGFGGSGGGELLAFDTRAGPPWKVVMIPFVPMSADLAIVIAENVGDFIRAIGRTA